MVTCDNTQKHHGYHERRCDEEHHHENVEAGKHLYPRTSGLNVIILKSIIMFMKR
jgi:hypothetical protein